MRVGTRRGRLLFAAEGESERATHIPHPIIVQPRHPSAEAALLDSDDVVQIDGAGLLQTIVWTDNNFGGHAAHGGADGCDGNAGEIADGGIARENQHGAGLVWGRKTDEPYLAALYSSGHAVTRSQILHSASGAAM
jgi:hypothetical protein